MLWDYAQPEMLHFYMIHTQEHRYEQSILLHQAIFN